MSCKIALFGWTASLGKILTVDNLRKHGLIVIDWCCMCEKSGEPLDDLFTSLLGGKDLWVEIFNRTRIA